MIRDAIGNERGTWTVRIPSQIAEDIRRNSKYVLRIFFGISLYISYERHVKIYERFFSLATYIPTYDGNSEWLRSLENPLGSLSGLIAKWTVIFTLNREFTDPFLSRLCNINLHRVPRRVT